MASESVSSVILFIAALLVAAAVAGTLVTNVNQISNAIDDKSGGVQEKIDTDVEIISDAGSESVYNASSENVTLIVKNTGERTLDTDPRALDVLVDGEYVQSDSMTIGVVSGEESWRPGAVAELEIDRSLASGEHRIVVVASGDEEVFEFYVP